jgi:exportin-T
MAAYSEVSSHQIEVWVLLSSDPAQTAHKQATFQLQAWLNTSSAQTIISTLLELLRSSRQMQVQFYALTYLTKSLAVMETASRSQLRTLALSFSNNNNTEAVFLENKCASLIVQLIITDDSEWISLPDDLLRLSAVAPSKFLKIMAELVPELMGSSDADTDKRDTRRIKNLLRGYYSDRPPLIPILFEAVVRLLAESLSSTPTSTNQGGTAITVLALKTIQAWLIWANLSVLYLQQSDTVLRLLLQVLDANPARAVVILTALETWQQWIASTVDESSDSAQILPENLAVVRALLERIHECQYLPYAGASLFDSEIEVVIQSAKLINNMGELVLCAVEEEPQQQSQSPTRDVFLLILDLFFRSFQYDDIDVSAAVFDFAGRLVLSMENPQNLAQQHIPTLINTLYKQIKYPLDFSYEFEEDQEAEEELYRNQLCKLYSKLVRVAPDTILQFLGEAAAQFFSQSAPTPDAEATLRLLFHYCEGIRPSPGLKTIMRNETFQQLIVTMHNSTIANHAHREVLCLYYETTARYYPIFEQTQHTPLLSQVLARMSGTSGLQNDHFRVRSRCCYLLLRLVKSVSSLLRPYVETAVVGIQSLLSNSDFHIRPDDTLNLFETMGLLLGKTGVDADQQQRYLRELVTPHVRSMEHVLATPGLHIDSEHYGEKLSGSIAAIAHLSKGFSKPGDKVRAILAEIVGVSLRVLEALPTSEVVRNKSMVLLQRMILCVGTPVLSQVPLFLFLLIQNSTSEDILFVSQIMNQLCIKFKGDAIPVLDAALLPFLRKCHSLVPEHEGNLESGLPPHLRAEQLSIQKISFAVLNTIAVNNAASVLISPTNASSLEVVLRAMSDGAIYVNDPVIKRTCARFFRELVDIWAGPASSEGELAYRRSFMAFTCHTFVPGVFQSMMDPMFDENDALQARIVTEFAHVIYLIKSKSESDELYQHGVLSSLDGTGRIRPDDMIALRNVSSVSDVERCMRAVFHNSKREAT